jgi:hypothetical protein
MHPRRIISLLFLLVLALAATGVAADSSTLGDKVVAFCKDHLGQQVGDGQCAALAAQALKAAGAKVRAGPNSPDKGDYVWGRQICLLEATPDGLKVTGDFSQVLPGDIMQFRNTKFITAHFDHHTAVIEQIVNPDKRKVQVLEQNIGGKTFVIEAFLPLNNLQEGWICIYRPLPR